VLALVDGVKRRFCLPAAFARFRGDAARQPFGFSRAYVPPSRRTTPECQWAACKKQALGQKLQSSARGHAWRESWRRFLVALRGFTCASGKTLASKSPACSKLPIELRYRLRCAATAQPWISSRRSRRSARDQPFLTDTNPHDIIWWTALQTARATPSQPHGSLPTRRGRTAHRHIKNAVSRVAADAPRQRTPHR